jgi:DNA helicase II / ATP-dependent DNA helicase PcrA
MATVSIARLEKLDPSQKRFCQSRATNLRLLAPAGSGKTLSLLWRCKLIAESATQKSERFLIITFTRVARDEILLRIRSDENFKCLRGVVKVDTLNRWGNNYLKKQVNSALVVKSSDKELFNLVKHNLRPIWSKTRSVDQIFSSNQSKYVQVMRVVNALKTSGFRHDSKNPIEDFQLRLDWLEECGLSRYVEANVEKHLDGLGLVNSGAKSRAERLQKFAKLWREFCVHLWSSAIMTLDDQKYWSLLTLQEKYSNSFFPEPNRYHHILVDEFQDINPLDLFLIQELVRVNRSTLTIVGDDDQAIYEWRGAVPRFILYPEEYFGASFENHTLEVNYRSPTNILRYSQNLIQHNSDRVAKQVTAANNVEAEVVHEHFADHNTAINFVLELARDAASQREPKALAVLARKKSQLIPLQIMLASEDIPFYAKEDLNVLLSEAFNDLKVILAAMASKNDRRSVNDIVNTFIRCCNKVKAFDIPKAEIRPLYGFLMSQRPRNFMKCVEILTSYPNRIRSSDPIEFALPLAKVMEAETVTEALQLIEREMIGLQKHYAKAEDDIFYKDPPFLHLADYARRYESDFVGFVDDVDDAIARMAYSPNQSQDSDVADEDLLHPVHLMTALRAKGKEYDTVAILDVNDGMWPIHYADSNEELQQERRLFYVAITRVRRRLFMLSVNQLANKPVRVSPYLVEMNLTIK